ncbi:MutS protein-like protein, partial [Operophtera brumata]
LFILEEIVDRPPEFQMFLNLLRQVEPIMILLDGKTQGTFVQTVKRTVFDNDAQGRGNCKLTFLSAREYSYEACKRRIFTLSLPNEPSPCTDEERTIADIVTIDEDTYRGLQIFSTVAHPSAFKKGMQGSNKEGL